MSGEKTSANGPDGMPAAAVVSVRRAELAGQLRELQETVRSELGWAPRSLPWVIPMVAAATGLVLGVALRRRVGRRGPRMRRPRAPEW